MEVKIFKPSPRVYQMAPERLRVRPAELGFAADRIVRTITDLAPLAGG